MNKLFTKIAALVLGMTMAVGVGVAVASSGKAAEKVSAAAGDPVTVQASTYTNSGNRTITGTGITWTGSGTAGTNSYATICSGATFTSNGTTGIDLTQSVSFKIKVRTVGGGSYKTLNIKAYSDSNCSTEISQTAAVVTAGSNSLTDTNSNPNLSFKNNASATTVYFQITSFTS